MLRGNNSVAFFYRIRLTSLRFLHSLSSNSARRTAGLVLRAGGFAAVAMSLMVGAACATLDSRPAADVVKERSQARWNALMTGDTKMAYGFFTPTTRATLKYEDYAANAKTGFWKSVTVDSVDCKKEGVCTAHMTIEYQYKGGRVKTPVQETWIQEGKNWWYAVKD